MYPKERGFKAILFPGNVSNFFTFIELTAIHYIKKCLLHQVLIQRNMYIVVLDKISHLQVKMVAIVT